MPPLTSSPSLIAKHWNHCWPTEYWANCRHTAVWSHGSMMMVMVICWATSMTTNHTVHHKSTVQVHGIICAAQILTSPISLRSWRDPELPLGSRHTSLLKSWMRWLQYVPRPFATAAKRHPHLRFIFQRLLMKLLAFFCTVLNPLQFLKKFVWTSLLAF